MGKFVSEVEGIKILWGSKKKNGGPGETENQSSHALSDPKMWENQVLFNFHYTLNTRWGVQYLQLLNMF